MPTTEVFNMDCMDYLKQCKDKQFDLAIVDPPYGIGEDGSRNKSRGMGAGSIRKKALGKSKDYKPFAGNDLSAPEKSYFYELQRVSKNQIIFGANHFISKIPFDSSCWIVWNKENGNNDFADCELAWTSFKSAVRMFSYKWHGMLQADMKNKEERMHPTQKPIALYKWLLQNYAKAGDTILDTHLGSGSSRIAAYEMGFDFTGIELDKDYFDASNKRFTEYVKNQSLFTPSQMYSKPIQLEIE